MKYHLNAYFNNLNTEILTKSSDEKPERITQIEYVMSGISSGGQNLVFYPEKLIVKKGRLYKIKNGRLVVKKEREFWTGKRHSTYYFKIR